MLGQPVTPTANQQIPLADWGYAIALEQKGQRVDTPTPGHHDFVTALDIFLTADHGGLPAQSEIQIGYAEANAQASEPPPLPVAPSQPTTTSKQPQGAEDEGHAPVLEPAARRQAEARRGRLRLPGLRQLVVHRHVRRGPRRRLGRLASRRRHLRARSARRCSRSSTAPSSRSGGTRSAAGGSGSGTTEATSSTTRTSRRTRRSRSTARS